MLSQLERFVAQRDLTLLPSGGRGHGDDLGSASNDLVEKHNEITDPKRNGQLLPHSFSHQSVVTPGILRKPRDRALLVCFSDSSLP